MGGIVGIRTVGSTPATVSAGYDGLGRMTSLGRTGSSTSAIGFDNADRMTSLAHVFTPTTGNQTWGFAYTPASQLLTTTSANSAWDWSQAAASAVNTVADGLNRNATVAGVGQSYDAFGNLTSDGTRTFTYDTENRLLTESGPITMALSYDPMGRLQQSVIGGATTQFLYDGDALVGEYPSSGNTPLRRYVHGPGTDNPVIWYEGGTMTAANASFLIADRQGSIVATASTSGALTVNYTYDAYGTPNVWGSIGTAPRFRYTGQAAIPEAGLYYYKARVYDPAVGRFLQTDPVGYGPDINWYAYVGNDPVNQADASGNCPRSICGEGGGELGLELPVEGETSSDQLGLDRLEAASAEARQAREPSDAASPSRSRASGQRSFSSSAPPPPIGHNGGPPLDDPPILPELGTVADAALGAIPMILIPTPAGDDAEKYFGPRTGMLREALAGRLLGPLGYPGPPLTRAQMDELGRSFVGPGAIEMSGGKGIYNPEKSRSYRYPTVKSYGGYVANLEVSEPGGAPFVNIHVHVKP